MNIFGEFCDFIAKEIEFRIEITFFPEMTLMAQMCIIKICFFLFSFFPRVRARLWV